MGQLISDPILSRVPLFATLPASETKHLQKTLRRSEIPANSILFHEGERGDRFYIVLEGQVEIVQALGTADERLAGVRGPGEYFGEMSLLNRDALRTMSVRARTPVQLLPAGTGEREDCIDPCEQHGLKGSWHGDTAWCAAPLAPQ